MSRIGKKPIPVPSGVKVELTDHTVKTSGPKGELAWQHPEEIAVMYDASAAEVRVTRSGDSARLRALHGLTRALIANMITGCAKAKLEGHDVSISLPTVVSGQEYQLEHPRGSVTLEVPFSSELGDLIVSVTFSAVDQA